MLRFTPALYSDPIAILTPALYSDPIANRDPIAIGAGCSNPGEFRKCNIGGKENLALHPFIETGFL